jgi:hypothetical protein
MDPAARFPPGDPTLIFAIACAAAMPTVLTVSHGSPPSSREHSVEREEERGIREIGDANAFLKAWIKGKGVKNRRSKQSVAV